MGDLVATRYAVRVMGVWVRRADALMQDGAVANAARALREREQLAAREAADVAALAALAPTMGLAGTPERGLLGTPQPGLVGTPQPLVAAI